MNKIKPIINKLKIRIPRQWLFFALASFWMFASIRVFMTAWEGILISKTPVIYFVIVSFIGSMIFTRLVFLKVTAKYIYRIDTMDEEMPSIFRMFSPKSYLLIVFMISMGISIKYYNLLPINILSMFLGALGLSLFTSSMHFLRAWKFKALI